MRVLRWSLLAAIVGGTCLLIYSCASSSVIYALAGRKLEMTLLITDTETSKPIPHAVITLQAEEWIEGKHEIRKTELNCDEDGKALLVRENNSCEDIIRPFRKTRTLIDLTWAVIHVSADGYRTEKEIWLHTAKYDNKGTFRDGVNYVQRLELVLALQPLPNQ